MLGEYYWMIGWDRFRGGHDPACHQNQFRPDYYRVKKIAIADWDELEDRTPTHALLADVDLVIVRYDDNVSEEKVPDLFYSLQINPVPYLHNFHCAGSAV